MRKLALILVAAFLNSACAADLSFEAIAGNGQEIRYVHGMSQVISRGGRSDVVATVEKDGRNRLKFTMYLKNRGENAIDFSPADVSAVYKDHSLEVVTAEELEHEATRRSGWKRAFVGALGAFAAGSAGANAGTSTYSGTISVESTNAYGGDPVHSRGYYYGTVHDSAAAQSAENRMLNRTSESLASIDDHTQADLAKIRGSAIRRTTVDPGAELFGDIVLDGRVSESLVLQVTVKARNDVHMLWFRPVSGAEWRLAPVEATQMLPAAPVAASEQQPAIDHARALRLDTLTKLHPDWREIDSSEAFQTWLKGASDDLQTAAKSSNPYEVGRVLDAYKADQKVWAKIRVK
jgi:hypothetical protein